MYIFIGMEATLVINQENPEYYYADRDNEEDTFVIIQGYLDCKFTEDLIRIKKQFKENFSIQSFLRDLKL